MEAILTCVLHTLQSLPCSPMWLTVGRREAAVRAGNLLAPNAMLLSQGNSRVFYASAQLDHVRRGGCMVVTRRQHETGRRLRAEGLGPN